MQHLNTLLDQWALNKIQEYKQDNLNMILDDAISSDLYSVRLQTIEFLTAQLIKRFSKYTIV